MTCKYCDKPTHSKDRCNSCAKLIINYNNRLNLIGNCLKRIQASINIIDVILRGNYTVKEGSLFILYEDIDKLEKEVEMLADAIQFSMYYHPELVEISNGILSYNVAT